MKHSSLLGLLASVIAFESATAQGVSIQTDQIAYEFGEPVEIMITNGSTATIAFPCDPSWEIRSIATEDLVSPCGCFTWITFLDPGSSLVHVAEQLDCSELGGPWPGGSYEITLTYFVLGARGFETTSTTFCVGPDCTGTSIGGAEQPSSWGRLKGAYR